MLRDVKPFLYRLFSDPEVIRIKFTPLRKLVAWLIATLREKKSQSLYKDIGGGSPIRRLTDDQARGVEARLRKAGREITIRTAFTCSPPLVEDVVFELAEAGVQKFLNFPLYPQYSFTTTKGSHDRVRDAVKDLAHDSALVQVGSWPTHPLFLQSHAELIQSEIRKFSEPRSEKIHLVFSAHSIPEKLVTKEGDPYQKEMEQTVQGVLEKSKWRGPWTLAWQSKLGPVKWLGPSTWDVIRKLGEEKVQQVLVVPISFVTDHVETLHEIDREFSEEAAKSGIREFRRTPGLNSYPTFLDALAEIALSQKEFWN